MRYFLLFILFSANVFCQSFGSFVRTVEQLPVSQRLAAIEKYLSTKKIAPFVEEDTLAHFVLYGRARSVLVNGDMLGWQLPDTLNRIECGESAFFYKTYVLPSDARLDYTFVVDGTEMLDPANPFIVPGGYGPHSELRMPGFVPSPYLHYRENVPRGTIDSIAINQHIVPPLKQYSLGVRPLKIYLPPGYDTLSNLPVVYVQDGFETIEFASLPTIIDNLIADEKITPVICVFVPPLRRKEEQMGTLRDHYKKYLCDELVPMIDKKYKTGRSPNKRALIGISSTGHSALSIAFRRNDLFRNVGGQSTTITSSLEELIREKASTLPSSMKIYLDCGRYDLRSHGGENFLISNRNFSQLLSSLHIPHYIKEVNDGHQWGSWRERMPEMITYFFRK